MVTKTTKVTLFFANFRYEVDLRQGLDVEVLRAAVKVDQMSSLYTILKEELKFVRYKMKEYYDRSRLEGPRLVRGDKVYLISRNLRIKRLSKKLDFKKLRPFKIDEYISQFNYRLILLVSMKLKTSIFYISMLELVPKNARLAITVEAEDEEEE